MLSIVVKNCTYSRQDNNFSYRVVLIIINILKYRSVCSLYNYSENRYFKHWLNGCLSICQISVEEISFCCYLAYFVWDRSSATEIGIKCQKWKITTYSFKSFRSCGVVISKRKSSLFYFDFNLKSKYVMFKGISLSF